MQERGVLRSSGRSWPKYKNYTKESVKVNFKKYLTSTVAVGALLAFSAPVEAVAGSVTASNSKIDLSTGGSVHTALIHADDGLRDAVFFVDGLSSNTELWFAGSAALTETVKMGAYQRFDVANQNSGYSFGSTTGAAATTSTTQTGKYSYIYFKHASMGTITMGDTEPGANGTMDATAGGFMGDAGASASAMDITSGTSAFSGSEVSDFISMQDPGADANNRFVYSSPSIGGFSFAGDLEQDGGTSIGIKYSGSIGGITASAGLGTERNGSSDSLTGGSLVLEHSSGLHGSINHYKYDLDVETTTATDYDGTTLVVGYNTKLNQLGNTNISVRYHETDDATGDGDEGESTTFGIVQSLDAVGGAVVLQYETLSFSNSTSTDFNDMDIVGMEVSFNF